jgi:hypothetical protein
MLIPLLPTFYDQIPDFLFLINSFSQFSKFFIMVLVYQIKNHFSYYVMFYHDIYQMYLVLQYTPQ